MKELIIIVSVFILMFAGCATTPQIKVVEEDPLYTYDGEIDPLDLFNWDMIEETIYFDGIYYFFMTRNPDVKSKFPIAAMCTFSTYTLVSYCYYNVETNDIRFFSIEDDNYYMEYEPEDGAKEKILDAMKAYLGMQST